MAKSHIIIFYRNKRAVSPSFINHFSIPIMNFIKSNRKIYFREKSVNSFINLRVTIINSPENFFIISIRCWVTIWFFNLYIKMKLNIFSTYHKTNLYSNYHTVALSIELFSYHYTLRRQHDNSSSKKNARMQGCISYNEKQGKNNYSKMIPWRLQCSP